MTSLLTEVCNHAFVSRPSDLVCCFVNEMLDIRVQETIHPIELIKNERELTDFLPTALVLQRDHSVP